MFIFYLLIVLLFLLIFFLVFMYRRSFEGLQMSDEKQNFLAKFYAGHFGRSIDPVIQTFYENKTFHQMKKDVLLYQSRVKSGKKSLSNMSVILTGLLRNGQDVIPSLEKFYNEWKTMCPQSIFLIVENDSNDNTKPMLIEWTKKDPSVILVCESPNSCTNIAKEFKDEDKSPHWKRIHRMADLRNLYLQYIRQHDLWFYDYLIVIDLDLVGTIFWDGVHDSFFHLEQDKSIDGMSCNGIMIDQGVYYDSFAYIQKNEPYEWDTRMDKRSHDEDVLKYITEKYTRNMDLDHVTSAFGGFSIYRLRSVRNKKAKYNYSNQKYSCEHTHFNRAFSKMMVNPRMIFLIEFNAT